MFFVLVLTLSCCLGRGACVGFFDPVRLHSPRMPDSSLHEPQRASDISHSLDCLHDICTNVKHYPKESILRSIGDKDQLSSWYGTVFNTTYEPVVSQRGIIFDHISDSQLCRTVGPRTFKPLAMRNRDSQWKFIVNVEPYVQGFTSELCLFDTITDEMSKTNSYCYRLGYSCKQQYHKIYLLTYEMGMIAFDEFSIPETCSCMCH